MTSLYEPHRVRFIAATTLVLGSLALAANLCTAEQEQALFGPPLGGDFPAFYMAGAIALSPQRAELYDLDVQRRFEVELFPNSVDDTRWIYPCAPFLTLVLAPLSLLPYKLAFAVWLCLTAACYLLGLALLRPTLLVLGDRAWGAVRLLSLSFVPLFFESWMGGQTTAIAFLSLAATPRLAHNKGPILAGMLLALCSYKPTLLLLIAPMLLFTRQFRMLLGLCLGVSITTLVSLAWVGTEGLAAYFELLLLYGRVARTVPDYFPLWKYVDIVSCLRLLNPEPGILAWGLLGSVGLGLSVVLSRIWLSSRSTHPLAHRLAWATAISFTPVLSPHFGIYDSALVVLAAIITIDAVLAMNTTLGENLTRALRPLLAVLYFTPWLTQIFAKTVGFQLYTVALAIFGGYLIMISRRALASLVARTPLASRL